MFGGFSSTPGASGRGFGDFGSGSSSFTTTTFGTNAKGQPVRRTVIVTKKPDGTEERQVHEEVMSDGGLGGSGVFRGFQQGGFSNGNPYANMSDEQLKELQKQQAAMMKTMTSAIKTAAKEAVKSAVKQKPPARGTAYSAPSASPLQAKQKKVNK